MSVYSGQFGVPISHPDRYGRDRFPMLSVVCGQFSRCLRDRIATGTGTKARGVRLPASKGSFVDMDEPEHEATAGVEGSDSGSASGRAGKQFDFRKYMH